MNTTYHVHILNHGGLANGMYTCSQGYATAALARRLGRLDPHLLRGKPIALISVETRPDGEGGRRLVRRVILDELPGVSGEPAPGETD